MARPRNNSKNPRNNAKRENKAKNYPKPNNETTPKESIPKGGSKLEKEVDPKVPEGVPNVEEQKEKNDPVWYSRYMELITGAGNLPYSYPLGSILDLYPKGARVVSAQAQGAKTATFDQIGGIRSIPGICTCKTKTSFGFNEKPQDPLNVASQLLYTHVRYTNSGRKNYDPADLMIYCGSTADIYSFIMWVQRIYAKAFVFSQANQYIGDLLLRSEDVDPADVRANLAQLRYWINAYINKVASFAVPADIMYYQRRAWMYAHVYLENPDNNVKDQLYQFAPDGFYRFALDANGAGMLEYKTLDGITGKTIRETPLKVEDLITIGDWLYANLNGNEDFGIMSGDILKAFEGKIIGLTALPETVDFMPVYDEYVLLQMRNANVLNTERGGTAASWGSHNTQLFYSGNVYQDGDGNLRSADCLLAQGAESAETISKNIVAQQNKILTVHTPTPNAIDNMEVSRMTLGAAETASQNSKMITALSSGADIVTEVGWTRNEILNGAKHTSIYWFNTSTLTLANMTKEAFISAMAFKYTPLAYVYVATTSGTDVTISDLQVVGDVDNFTIIDNAILKRLHEVSLLSMLSVAGVAKVVS